VTVNFDSNLLVSYYQNKSGLAGSGGSSVSNGLGQAAAPKYAPTAPWAPNSGVLRANDLVKAALLGNRFINENAAKLDLEGASTDYRKLFALYQGLNALSGLADQAASKTVSSGDLARLQSTFSRGLAEVGGYADSLKLDQLRLTRGSTFLTDKTAVTVPSNGTDYITQTLFTGKSTDEVPAFQGAAAFNLSVKRLGVTSNISVDLSELGADSRTIGNVVNLINSKLQASGAATRFAVNRVTAPPRTIQAGGKAITLPAVGDAFALQVKGDSAEQLTFSAAPRTAVYVTTSAGNPDPDKNPKTTDAVIQNALLKIDPAGATTPDTRIQTGNFEGSVGAVHGSQTGPDGHLYVLADVTKTVNGQTINGKQDMAVLNYDSAGKLVYVRTLGADTTATGLSLAVSADGHVAVAGSVTGGLDGATNGPANSAAYSGKTDSFVTLLDSSGNEVWTDRRGSLQNDEATAVNFGADGVVYVAGRTQTAMPGVSAGGTGGWDSYLTSLSTTDKGAPRTLFTQQFGTTGNDLPAGIVVDGEQVTVASNENGAGVLRSFGVVQDQTRTTKTWASGMLTTTVETLTQGAVTNSTSTVVPTPGAPDATTSSIYASVATVTVGATRNLGDLQGGVLVGLKEDGGKLYVAGSTRNATLSISGVTQAHAGGMDAFAATLSTDLSSTAQDGLAYYGGAGDNTVSGMAVAAGRVYLTGSAGADLPGLTAVGTKDGYLAELNIATGAVLSSQRIGGKDGIATATSVAVDVTGASDLDKFGLPTGTLTYARSNLLVAATSARPGDQFQIRTKSGAAPTTITIDAKETLDTLKAKIRRATGFSAKVEVVSDGAAKSLKISPLNDSSTIEIMPGQGGKNVLTALGLPEGVVRNTKVVNGTSVSTAPGGTVYGLGLNLNINLSTPEGVKNAQTVVSAALSKIRSAYRDLLAAATPKSTTPAAGSGGPAPAYLRSQIANYQAGLNRLTGGA